MFIADLGLGFPIICECQLVYFAYTPLIKSIFFTVQSCNFLAIDQIRAAIVTRNSRPCVPKFLVKPKAKKTLEEFKSLRLKTAVSANPMATVQWDRNGIVLETGNKYSIYNDGDFYYLEVRSHFVTMVIMIQ